ncbi:DUF424 domain-containing protein [Halorarius halobius]|uniref:DUF424 domain-containing protein n=1 Tax=Halorarius halobius TaxID=2962671 RepID=UPI0020CCE1B7|nr:DUF424 domain-containing protein [Halorarius halobius]
MLLSERETPEGRLVAVADADTLGETFENGEVSLTVDSGFYDGEEATAEEVTSALARCSVANLVGEEAVGVAVEAGFVEEGNVLEVGETRHAQYLRL